jgi:hypothetical protein
LRNLRAILQRSQQLLHFLHRVVVHESDAQKSSQALDIQLFRKVHSLVVPVPREDSAFRQLGALTEPIKIAPC